MSPVDIVNLLQQRSSFTHQKHKHHWIIRDLYHAYSLRKLFLSKCCLLKTIILSKRLVVLITTNNWQSSLRLVSLKKVGKSLRRHSCQIVPQLSNWQKIQRLLHQNYYPLKSLLANCWHVYQMALRISNTSFRSLLKALANLLSQPFNLYHHRIKNNKARSIKLIQLWIKIRFTKWSPCRRQPSVYKIL